LTAHQQQSLKIMQTELKTQNHKALFALTCSDYTVPTSAAI
jgi:hypothetical protein